MSEPQKTSVAWLGHGMGMDGMGLGESRAKRAGPTKSMVKKKYEQ